MLWGWGRLASLGLFVPSGPRGMLRQFEEVLEVRRGGGAAADG
jgi:hypothetical protein